MHCHAALDTPIGVEAIRKYVTSNHLAGRKNYSIMTHTAKTFLDSSGVAQRLPYEWDPLCIYIVKGVPGPQGKFLHKISQEEVDGFAARWVFHTPATPSQNLQTNTIQTTLKVKMHDDKKLTKQQLLHEMLVALKWRDLSGNDLTLQMAQSDKLRITYRDLGKLVLNTFRKHDVIFSKYTVFEYVATLSNHHSHLREQLLDLTENYFSIR